MRTHFWPAWMVALTALCVNTMRIQATDYVNAVTNTPNLLGYWRFDPASLTNSLVNGYTGTLQGNAQLGAAGSGCPLFANSPNQALVLDGTNSYLSTSLTGQITSQGTVLAWVYLTALPSSANHIFQITSQAQSGDDFDFQIETDNRLRFFTDSGTATVYAQPLTTNRWYFFAASFIANSTRCLYLDGQLVTNSIAGSHAVNNTALWMGNNPVFGPRMFQGRLDEVAIFNRALTATEIAKIYMNAVPPKLNLVAAGSSTILSWPTNYTGFSLQTNSSLSSGTWGTLTTSFGINATNYAVTNAASGGSMFYRLKQ